MSDTAKSIYDLVPVTGNSNCVDCNFNGVQYASSKIGVFLCDDCASIHRSLGASISRPKLLSASDWDLAEIKAVANVGNERAKQIYEHSVPLAYKRPKTGDPLVMREQWIRAKYERREFVEGAQVSYLNGHKEGPLMKRGKAKKSFQRRRFVLDTTENTLKYYKKDEAKDAKACLRLDFINVTIVPEKIGNPNALQIYFEHGDKIRNIYAYAESGQDLIEWYTAIRAAKLTRLAIAYPSSEMEELSRMVTRDFLREGWLFKTGPRAHDAYRRRWCTLDGRRLMYYEDTLDPHPKGEVFIGLSEKNFRVSIESSPGAKDPGYGFALHTPDRTYHFSADSEQERKEWIDTLNQVLVAPLSPQDSKILYRSSYSM